MSTSLESNHGSFGGAMKMARREQDFCQNYNCCGLQLNSMHDLLEHVRPSSFQPAVVLGFLCHLYILLTALSHP